MRVIGETGMGLVVAATVTYGDRGHLCEKVIEAALDSGVDRVVVVDNGATANSRQRIQELALKDARILLTEPGPNLGSAGGFTRALREAALLGEYVWLLDDDNVPACDALSKLQEAVQMQRHGDTVFFSYRASDPNHARLIRGGIGYPPPGSFMNFDILQTLSRVFTVSCFRRAIPNGNVEVPYGPYGGMYARSSTLSLVGPPSLWMELYEDDTEFTIRLRAAGATLLLCTASRVHDIDGKWSELKSARGPARFLSSADAYRMILASRNRAYIDFLRSRGNSRRYRLNRGVFLLVARLQAERLGAQGPLRALLKAIRDGETRGAAHEKF